MKVLVPLPDNDFDTTEVAVPWKLLTEAGHEVIFATERGGSAPACDQRLLDGVLFGKLGAYPEPIEFYEELRRTEAFKTPVSWKTVDPTAYDGLLLAGGHAPGMRQYLGSDELQAFIARFWATGKPVGAICHGVLVLARSRDADGVSVLVNRRTTCLPKYMERGGFLLTFWKLGRYYRTYPAYVEDEVVANLRAPTSSSAVRGRPSVAPAPTTRTPSWSRTATTSPRGGRATATCSRSGSSRNWPTCAEQSESGCESHVDWNSGAEPYRRPTVPTYVRRMAESYARGETDTPLLDETIGGNFERTVAAWPDREALVEYATGKRWTWSELNRAVDDLAIGLLRVGITKGDRVGIWAPNCADWTITQYATAKIGAILVNINPAYRTHELAYALNQSGTKLLISAEEFKGSSYRDMVEEVRGDVASLEQVVFLDSPDWTALNAHDPSVTVLELLDYELFPDDPINIQYTSGTTGYPKGATLSHRNILNNGYFTTELINFTETDRLCIPVPFYHCFGMVMGNLGCTSHGATMIIPAPGFDPEITLRAIADEKCTGVYGVPTMFIAMQNHPSFADHDLSSLRTGIMAGSICPVEVMKRCINDMGMDEVSIAYGMTETSPVSCQTRDDDDLDRRTASIGRVHPHLEIKIVDPVTGETVERGQPGEFCTRGYSVMLGYWNDEEKTAEAIDADGWMHTGDLAEMREDGYCNIVGRIKDMVIRGGENIYPREIEEFLYQHPDIEDVQVIGVPDEKYGEELCAWIKMRAGAEPLDADAVRAYATGKLSHYKIPRYVIVVDDFPMTVTGKIRKVAMREETSAKLGLA